MELTFERYKGMSKQEIKELEGWNDLDLVDFADECLELDEEQSLEEFLSLTDRGE